MLIMLVAMLGWVGLFMGESGFLVPARDHRGRNLLEVKQIEETVLVAIDITPLYTGRLGLVF